MSDNWVKKKKAYNRSSPADDSGVGVSSQGLHSNCYKYVQESRVTDGQKLRKRWIISKEKYNLQKKNQMDILELKYNIGK